MRPTLNQIKATKMETVAEAIDAGGGTIEVC